VQWVEKKAGSDINFIRVDISAPHAKAVMERFSIPLNSTYIIFDPSGQEVWRSYMIPMNAPGALRVLKRMQTA